MLSTVFRKQLLVLFGIILVALNLRPAITGLSPLITIINTDIPISNLVKSFIGFLPAASFAIFGLLTPHINKKIPLIKLLLISLTMITIGDIGRATSNNIYIFIFCFIITLAGMAAGNILLPPLVKAYFPNRIGTITSLYVTAVIAGTALPPLFSVSIAQASNWRISIASLTIISTIAIIPWAYILIKKEFHSHVTEDIKQSVIGNKNKKQHKTQQPKFQIWKTPMAWGLATLFGMTSFTTYAMAFWLPQFLVDTGYSIEEASLFLGIYAAFGLPTTMIIPLIAPKMKNPFPIVIACVILFSAGALGLIIAPTQLTLLWVILAGLAPGTFPLALVLINMRTKTQAGSAALSGFVQGIGYTLGSLGPLIFGIFHDITNDWHLSFATLLIVLIFMTIGGYIVCKSKTLEDITK